MAKAQLVHLQHLENRLFEYKIDQDMWPVYHFHPEMDLLLVLKNTGTFISGDYMGTMEPGTLILNGPGIPHALRPVEEDEGDSDRPSVVVLHFSYDTLLSSLLHYEEMMEVRKWFEDASRGYEFKGLTRKKLAEMMISMQGKSEVQQFAIFIQMMEVMANSEELVPLASEGFSPTARQGHMKRANRVFDYLHQEFRDPLTLAQVAEVACMSPKAFCRFFKSITGMTLVQYINHLRIAEAGRLLAETELGILDIALECGYRSTAHFNKKFRELKEDSPSQYRKKMQLL
ncbi:AraC family transcriptional regulator [Rubritalea marina]|uniref:AraC family transcriptional regulator n=1 Tax=Rubritalea marina TaxID=361055 RepID=UPI00035E88F6|nr:AraC family transcriptional regulator [Rubritalea marina]